MYVKKDSNEWVIILCINMDDLLITGNDEFCISKFKPEPMKEIEMNDLGLMADFLGIEFYKFKKGLLMHQIRYALEILKIKSEMERFNIATTPIETRLHMLKNEHEQDVNPVQYHRLI